jgi:hypothetical protein
MVKRNIPKRNKKIFGMIPKYRIIKIIIIKLCRNTKKFLKNNLKINVKYGALMFLIYPSFSIKPKTDSFTYVEKNCQIIIPAVKKGK